MMKLEEKLRTLIMVHAWVDEKGEVCKLLLDQAIEKDEEIAKFAKLCDKNPQKAAKKLMKFGKQLLKEIKSKS